MRQRIFKEGLKLVWKWVGVTPLLKETTRVLRNLDQTLLVPCLYIEILGRKTRAFEALYSFVICPYFSNPLDLKDIHDITRY